MASAGLAQQRQQWQKSAPRSYRYTYEQTCFCEDAELEVTVIDGQKQSVHVVRSHVTRPPTTEPAHGWSVDEQFDRMDTLLRDAATFRTAPGIPVVEAEYDQTYGYPKLVNVNIAEPDSTSTFKVTSFTPLP